MDGCPVKFGCWLWRERERERERETETETETGIISQPTSRPATNDANLLIDGSPCTYYSTVVITILGMFGA
jgi:hypothetical protein